jgi:hypothetical protein
VMSSEMLTTVPIVEGDAKKRGVQYEVADGTLIPNQGERNFVAIDEFGAARDMKVQICDVNKSLLSVRRVAAAGNVVVLEAEGGYIENKQTGQRMNLTVKDGMYMVKMWVPKGGGAAGFTRQA